MSFSFTGLAHKIAWVAGKVVDEAKAIAGFAQKVEADQATIDKIAKIAAAFVGPQAVQIERAAFQALGLVAQAALDTGAAVSSNGLNIAMDAATFADFKAIAQFLAAELQKRGVAPSN